MYKIQENVSLQPFNTFGVKCLAHKYLSIDDLENLVSYLEIKPEEKNNLFILNGGSNILFTRNVMETVIHLKTQGIQVIADNENSVIVEAQAGENWNDFVQFCIQNDWGGLENLSLIPGNVGTSPMQNIGAYGVEIKDCFHALQALNLETLQIEKLNRDQCKFGYRDSFFKNEGKGKFIIGSVEFELQKKPHSVKTEYGAIQEVLESKGIQNPSIQQVSQAIIEIRQSKLPDPKILGNAGSFFKNPIVDTMMAENLKKELEDLPYFKVAEGKVKIPAGWLIEKAGWKGKRVGECGVYEKQALILVNYGNASGNEIYQLSESIIKDVKERYGIPLEREVNIY